MGRRQAVMAGIAALLFFMCRIGPLGATQLSGEELLNALKTGGYVIYLRHGMTDTSRADADPISVKDCSTQRPLSDLGRAQASKIGGRSARSAFTSITYSQVHIVERWRQLLWRSPK
jgi:Tfp pilus assembly protein PilV